MDSNKKKEEKESIARDRGKEIARQKKGRAYPERRTGEQSKEVERGSTERKKKG